MRRRLLFFVLGFLPIFAVCLWLYPRVLPYYQSVVVRGINAGLHRLEPPMRMENTEDGGWRTYTLHPDGSESFYWSRPGIYLNLLYLSVALLPAMLLATPVPPAQRLRILVLGMALLLVFHVLAGFGLVWAVRCLASNPESFICKSLRTTVNIFGQLMSFALWGLLTWEVWLPERVEGPARRATP